MELIFIPSLVILAILYVLSAPVALIIAIISIKQVKKLSERIESTQTRRQTEIPSPPSPQKQPFQPTPQPQDTQPTPPPQPKPQAPAFTIPKLPKKPTIPLEQLIGTRLILIAGLITVFVGVGFFLKYAYDNSLLGPMGRVMVVAASGLIALIVGEITRRRGFEIVAKGVTALGFAILYAAVFSAYRFYDLIDSTPALLISIMITAAAMLYAVSLNEVIIAVISLIGGFLAPIIISTGQNLPNQLFIYSAILGLGAMLCAFYRKWRAVNLVAFLGTFLLYIAWFEKFYRPQIDPKIIRPDQINLALCWLASFFVLYLVLPVFHEIIRKVKAKREDIILLLANSMVTFFYLWTILHQSFRTELAFCAIAICIIHLVLLAIVSKRCTNDTALRLSLLVISLFFLTIAIPLYLKMYAIAVAWALEGLVLILIAKKYQSFWTIVAGWIALLLSIIKLCCHLPLHHASFDIILNPAFESWIFVAAVFYLCDYLFRKRFSYIKTAANVSQILFTAASLVLFASLTMEWFSHCDYNFVTDRTGDLFPKVLILLMTAFLLLFSFRPICPKGILCKVMTWFIAIAGSLITIVVFSEFYKEKFVLFANIEFANALVFVLGIFVSALLFKIRSSKEPDTENFYRIFAFAAFILLGVLLTQEIYLYWYYRHKADPTLVNWSFLSHMYISITWAAYAFILMILGFWKNLTSIRYLSIGIFALLLAKVFILDTSEVKSVYRIAAFLVTGIVLISVSYLYQFLKKKGYFNAFLNQPITVDQNEV